MRLYSLLILCLWVLPNVSRAQVGHGDTNQTTSISHDTISLITDTAVTLADEEVEVDSLDLSRIDPVLRTSRHQWWVFLLAIFLLMTIGLLKNMNPGRHALSFGSYFMNPKAEIEIVEDGNGIDLYQITQIFISCVVLGWVVMVFQPFDLNFTMVGPFALYLLFILAICLLYILKYFTHFIVGLVLQSDRLSRLMVYSQSNMVYALCILLFPFAMVHYYTPDEVLKVTIEKVLIVLVVAHYFVRLVKSFRIYFQFFPYSRVYIFIYLCTLEILPLLMLLVFIGLL